MGKQTSLAYRGTRDNLVYYELNGGYYIRSKPTNVRQTAATKASAGKFGVAVRIGKSVRSSLTPLLPDSKDRQLMFRLNTAIYKWLLTEPPANSFTHQAITSLAGFQFNERTTLAERLKLRLQTDWQQTGNCVVHIPSIDPLQQIAAPAHTLLVELQLAVLSCRMSDQTISNIQSTTISIPYTAQHIPAQQIHLPVQIATGFMAIVAGALKYTVQNKQGVMVKTKSGNDSRMEWLPAAIIDAVYGN